LIRKKTATAWRDLADRNSTTMQLVTYNIQYGRGRDGRFDLDRIAEAIDGADLIALQEVERFWSRSGMVDQVQVLAKRLPEYWWSYGANLDLFSPVGFPGEASDRRRQFGNLILSRTPILASRNLSLPRVAGAQQTMQRGALEAIVATPTGRSLRVYSTHLTYLSPAARRVQLETIFTEHHRAIEEGGAWAGAHPSADGWMMDANPEMPQSAVILGDMNFSADEPEYRRVFEDAATPFVDAWKIARGDDPTPTHAAGHIDHGWVTHDIANAVTGAHVDTNALGSDHHPVWFSLDI
jgi:endonuclease/exonuclease/phosphatase family metal-dependent hydrolase